MSSSPNSIPQLLRKAWNGIRGKKRRKPYLPDLHPDVLETIQVVRPFTQTSPERIAALCEATKYIQRAKIPGQIVECGVWRGGSMMTVARTLLAAQSTERHLYLFDTFEGMTEPTAEDVSTKGDRAEQLMAEQSPDDPESVWCVSSLDEVRQHMESTSYPTEKVHYIPGRVEDTLPGGAPEQIALLRLDTDWYESTRHEMEQLFPRLMPGGVLIIDDYGHWAGARKAVDEYLATHNIPLLLNRIDYTGRIGVYHPLPPQAATEKRQVA